MNQLPVILIHLEMLCVNLLSFGYCCQRKYSRAVTGLVLTVCTLILFGVSLPLLPDFGDGSFWAIGFVYLVPFTFLYHGKWSRLFFIMCMCWDYTTTCFVLSVQASRLLDGMNLDYHTLLFQSGILAVSIYPFFKWGVPKYLFILQNLERFDRSCAKYFNFNCFLHFIIVWILHLTFLPEAGSFLKILSILLVSSITILSYIMLYRMITDSERIRHLEWTAQQDALTGLANRSRLLLDLHTLLQGNQVFSILFMDLDRFKEINDRYGHITGDQYLQHFAAVCSEIFREAGRVYRFGGDEFVVLYQGSLPPEVLERLRLCREWEDGAPCPFNQVSIGSIVCEPPFPDAEQLIREVDQNMYDMKAAAKDSWPL